MTDYTIDQLINIQRLEKLLEAHTQLSGIACGLMDNDGNIIVGVGLQQICTQYLWEHPDSFARCWRNDPEIKQELHTFNGDLFECRCKNGMINTAMPIVIEGNRLGVFFSGQFFYADELPELDLFRQQAEELGFETEAYLAAVRQTPLFDRMHVDTTMRFLHQLVQLLAENGYTNLMRLREQEEQKRIEIQLYKQAEFQQTLLNCIGMVGTLVMIIENARIIYIANRELVYSFGYTDSELDAHPLLTDIIHPDERERIMEYYRCRLSGKTAPVNYEAGLVTKTGERRDYEIAVVMLPNTVPQRIIIVGKDITERKRILSKLAAQEQQFRALAEHSPDNIVRYDTDCRMISLNPKSEKTLGLSATDLLGKTPTEKPPWDDRYKYQETLQKVLSTSIDNEIDVVFPDTDRGIRHHNIRFVAELASDGTVSGVLAIGRDITERKQMEADLAMRETQFRTLAEHLPDNIVRYDKQCRAIYVNPEMERTLGYLAAQITGKTPLEYVGENAREYQNLIQQVLATGDPAEIDLVVPDVSKGMRNHNIRFISERDAEGAISGVLAIGLDITERKQTEQKLYEKQQRLHDMALELTISEERERRRIAVNLHDNLGQDLVLTRIKLGDLTKTDLSPDQSILVNQIKRSTDTAIKQIRSLKMAGTQDGNRLPPANYL